MATMYCALCDRPVDAGRQVGLGTAALAVVTGGLWLFAIPFFRKRCSICKSTAVSMTRPAAGGSGSLASRVVELEQRLRLVEDELETADVELTRLKAERDFYSQLLGNPASRGVHRGKD